MLPWVTLALVVLVAGACGGARDATRPTPVSASPLIATRDPTPTPNPSLGTFAFVAELKSSSQVPPVTDAEASCNGQGRFIVRARLDPAGKITMATAQFSFFVRNCPDSTRITLAHIHQAPAGQNGAVTVDSGLKANEPIVIRGGEIGVNVEGVPMTDFALLTDLVANPVGYYFNVHSVSHIDGLLRGQLTHER
jgi:hypothetical protein